jgi:glutamyl-tRNA synthetase
MKLEELKALEPALAGDFRAIEPHLQALDKHLTLRTFLDGYGLGEIDNKIWLTLRANRAAFSFIKRGTLVNLARWFIFIEERHPEIQVHVKQLESAAKAKVVAGSKAGASYNLNLQNAEKGIVTRFLPEPS